ncbi:flagellar protein FlgN [Cohnella cholangitidis]|uniref:Flagellar protein FlgN n=1 Tax=Cohnella cholangitidis TaxID=2598458 RepID=A0A7G5BXJ9_9BACL|nr:flagellar protein FlgN [Cohnella cholangitidis]QMV41683.1 flagellar protein FlgN [Cohnella cholangitidis]
MTFQPLMDSLHQMHSLYEKLLELGTEKKDRIIRNQLNELTLTLTQESKVLKSLAAVDQARLSALTAFQRATGLKEDSNMRLEDVAVYCSDLASKQSIENISIELSQQIKALRALNETNQLLVHHALDIVNHTLDLLVGSPEDEMVYTNPNQANPYAKRNSYFDTRA